MENGRTLDNVIYFMNLIFHMIAVQAFVTKNFLPKNNENVSSNVEFKIAFLNTFHFPDVKRSFSMKFVALIL